MCRWLAYSGPSIHLDELVVRPENSLVEQSRDAQEAKSTINADGFGIGWYGSRDHPGLFRDVLPAWNDENLLNLCEQVSARLFFGHVRASTGTAINRANCHPFRRGRWMFMHNGQIGGFEKVRRQLSFAIEPALYPHLAGTTDSEVFFFLALTNGLEDDPETALAKTVGQVLAAMAEHDIRQPFRMTAAVSNGDSIYAFRFASDAHPPSLYYALGSAVLHGDAAADAASCMIVSEPLDETAAHWSAVAPGAMVVAEAGTITVRDFQPVS